MGRPRQFCSQACRQWDWVGRQRARELQLNEHELIVTKAELDRAARIAGQQGVLRQAPQWRGDALQLGPWDARVLVEDP